MNMSLWADFIILGDFVILDWIPNIGMKAHLVILGSFGYSEMSSSFDDFDILGWISHPRKEFIILH